MHRPATKVNDNELDDLLLLNVSQLSGILIIDQSQPCDKETLPHWEAMILPRFGIDGENSQHSNFRIHTDCLPRRRLQRHVIARGLRYRDWGG